MTPPWPLPPRSSGEPQPDAEPVESMWPLDRRGRTRLRRIGRAGRYELSWRFGSGGQAHIWMAHDTVADHRLVIKTAREDRERSADLTSRRLAREARILAAVGDAPHVLRLADWGPEHLRPDADEPGRSGPDGWPLDDSYSTRHAWLALPYLDHWVLEEALQRFGPFGARVGRAVALELARALDALHCRAIVHRDVAPGNVLLTPSGVVLADLGMAWSAHHGGDDDVEQAMSTGLTEAVGADRTPGWWAPELADPEDHERPDRKPSADVFGWGLFVFTAVTGRHPWSHADAEISVGLTSWEILRMRQGAPPMGDVAADIGDQRLAALVAAALSPDPADRPTAAEIVSVLGDGRPVPARVVAAARATSARPDATDPAVERLRRLDVRTTAMAALAAAGSAVWALAAVGALPTAVQGEFAALGTVGAAVLAVLFLLAAITAVVWRRAPRAVGTVDEVADQLAVAVRTQWQSEVAIRRLNEPYPLPVSWTAAPQHLFVNWESIVLGADQATRPHPAAAHAASPASLAGSGTDLVDVVTGRLPIRRLVVLGEPGAGKTMLLVRLVLGLLVDRSAVEDRIPVLLSLASWNPADQSLRAWLRHAITTDHPWLRRRAPGPTGDTYIDVLLDRHRILPVLDGLDEIPDAGRAFAIERINAWLGGTTMNQLVLSSRLAEYERMVAPGTDVVGAKLAGSSGVVLEGLEPDTVRDYLRHDAGGGRAALRWQPVVDELGSGSPVDAALRIPLMVGMARTIYNPRAGQQLPENGPDELCRSDVYPTRPAVERHLFEGFLPAAYRARPDESRRRRWTAVQSERWLRNLARHLGDPNGPGQTTTLRAPLGRTDLAWWELHASVSPWIVGLLAAVVPGLAVGLAAWFGPVSADRTQGPAMGIGLGIGLTIGVIVAAALRGWHGPPWVRGLTSRWSGGNITGIAVSAAVAVPAAMVGGLLGDQFGLGRGWTGGLVGAIGVGLGVGPVGGLLGCIAGAVAGGVAVGLTAGAGGAAAAGILDGLGAGVAVAAILIFAGRLRPARGLRGSAWSWRSGIFAGVVAALGIGLTGGPWAAIVGLLGGSCLGLLNADADPQATISPKESLARDRATFVAFGLLAAVLVAIGAGLAVHPYVGVAGGITVGLVFGSLQAAWGRYMVALCWLAVRGEVPWRLTAFLADAHRERGVLRQVGAVYQFRHADLQRHLAQS